MRSRKRKEIIEKFLQGDVFRKECIEKLGEEEFNSVERQLDEEIQSILASIKDWERFASNIPEYLPEGEALEVLGVANRFLLHNLPYTVVATPPQPVEVFGKKLWLSLIVLTSQGFGLVEKLGHIAVDLENEKVVGCTKLSEVGKQVRRCYETKREELQAAFLKARVG